MPRPCPKDLLTGYPLIDTYLNGAIYNVLGMSSRFATAICANLMLFQNENAIIGDFAEIGTFKGRFFIAQSLALKPQEQALGIDSFDWPDEGVLQTFIDNCTNNGLKRDKFIALKGVMKNLPQEALKTKHPLRLIHIDGDHSPEPLRHDLEVAKTLLHPQGLIVLDDMLHPSYPFLTSIVQRFLEDNANFKLMAVIDREDIVGAAKFVLCRTDSVSLYENYLMNRFKKRHFLLGGDALGHHCVVLTIKPRLARV